MQNIIKNEIFIGLIVKNQVVNMRLMTFAKYCNIGLKLLSLCGFLIFLMQTVQNPYDKAH